MADLKRPSIERPCNPMQFAHCFHETGLTVMGGTIDGKPPYTHALCCHCGMTAVRDSEGTMSLHGHYLPSAPPEQVQA